MSDQENRIRDRLGFWGTSDHDSEVSATISGLDRLKFTRYNKVSDQWMLWVCVCVKFSHQIMGCARMRKNRLCLLLWHFLYHTHLELEKFSRVLVFGGNTKSSKIIWLVTKYCALYLYFYKHFKFLRPKWKKVLFGIVLKTLFNANF